MCELYTYRSFSPSKMPARSDSSQCSIPSKFNELQGGFTHIVRVAEQTQVSRRTSFPFPKLRERVRESGKEDEVKAVQ